MRKGFYELENRLIYCLIEVQPWHSLSGEAARCFSFSSALMWLAEWDQGNTDHGAFLQGPIL